MNKVVVNGITFKNGSHVISRPWAGAVRKETIAYIHADHWAVVDNKNKTIINLNYYMLDMDKTIQKEIIDVLNEKD